MLARRLHPILHKHPPKPPPPPLVNGLFAWGRASEGAIGGGYYLDGTFDYPQGVIGVSHVVKVACGGGHTLVLKDDGSVWMFGANNKGQEGRGVWPLDNAERDMRVLVPQVIPGGLPIYAAATYTNKKGVTFNAPASSIVGPALVNVVDIATGGAGVQCAAVLANGRCVTWGGNLQGMLGNGYEEQSLNPQALWEEGKWRPQLAPWYVQTGGPRQEEAAGGSNILQNVIAVETGHEIMFYLLKSGLVYFSGALGGFTGPSENGHSPYAEVDPVWAAAGLRAVQIDGGKFNYIARLADGSVRVVGLNGEGCWGTGTAYNPGGGAAGTRDRQVKNPEPSPGVHLSDIVQVAKGEYACFALTKAGRVYAWGSNEEGQLGLGLPVESGIYRSRPELIPGLENVVSISASGALRGNGEIGADVVIARLADGTIRTWGNQYDNGAFLTERGEAIGVLGDGTQDDKVSPAMVAVTGISAIAAGAIHMCVTQDPGSPATASVRVSSPASKKMRVDWTPPAGAFRGAEGWEVRFRRVEVNPATGKRENVIRSGKLAAGVTSWEGTLPAGWEGSTNEVEVIVEEVSTVASLVPTGGAVKTATAKSVPVNWALPAKPEPGWYVEWRRTEEYLTAKGEKKKEKWQREPMVAGGTSSLTVTLTPTTHSGGVPEVMEGEQVEVAVVGAFEPAFKKRIVTAVVRP